MTRSRPTRRKSISSKTVIFSCSRSRKPASIPPDFYSLVHTQPGGFDEFNFSCSVFDKSYAEGAGAVVEPAGDKRCMFSSYNSLLKATRAVVAVVKTNPDVIGSAKYRSK